MSAALAIVDDWTAGPCPAPARPRARLYLATHRHDGGRVIIYGPLNCRISTAGPAYDAVDNKTSETDGRAMLLATTPTAIKRHHRNLHVR